MGADLFRLPDNVEAGDFRCPGRGFQHCRDEAQGGGFTGTVDAEQAVDFAGFARERNVVNGVDFAALFVFEDFG